MLTYLTVETNANSLRKRENEKLARISYKARMAPLLCFASKVVINHKIIGFTCHDLSNVSRILPCDF
jgi:hypothetical protein